LSKRRDRPTARDPRANPGVVVETVGRRVLVRDADGDRVCFLSGQRAVVGDKVWWIPAQGEGGKLVEVSPRHGVLARMDPRGREQLLAANLGGLLITASCEQPGFRRALVDRYLVTANLSDIAAGVIVTKTDLGVTDEVEAHLADLQGLGVPVIRVCATAGEGVSDVATFLASQGDTPWALVGASGVGKTSLMAALLPDQDVGAVGAVSAYWGTGRHTTTGSRIFSLPQGGNLADSPGIRNLTPSVVDEIALRDHFPGVRDVCCQYRDCLHREGEAGCQAEDEVAAGLLASYRHVLNDVLAALDRRRPG